MFKSERNIPRLVNLNNIKKGMRVQLRPYNLEDTNYYLIVSIHNSTVSYLDAHGKERTTHKIAGQRFWTID